MQQPLKFIILCFMLTAFPAFAGTLHAAGPAIENNESHGTHATKSWTLFPVVAYNSETGLIFGVSTFYFPRSSDKISNKSSVDIISFGTTKGQFFLSLMPDLYSNNNTYRLRTKMKISSWKSDFYGIGKNTPDISEEYKTTSYGLELSLDRRFPWGFTLGPVADVRWENVRSPSGGMIESGMIAGGGKGLYVGLGISAGYDTRDNNNAPHSGILARYEYVNYITGIGSDLDFQTHKFDLRHYVPTSRRTTFAIAAHMRISRGEIPFRMLSAPDGVQILRGIENRRYIDRDLLAFQTEFRFPVQGKISAAVFADVAQVEDDFANLKMDEFTTSVGGGLRYALNQEKRLRMRLDMAWVDSGFGVVVSFREAY